MKSVRDLPSIELSQIEFHARVRSLGPISAIGWLLLALTGCHGAPEPREFSGTIENLNGQHVVQIWAEGVGGQVSFVAVEIDETDTLWQDQRRCANQVGWTVTMNGTPLEQKLQGGIGYTSLGSPFCNVGYYVVQVEAASWPIDTEIGIDIVDSTGDSEHLRFLNFVATPIVELEAPASGVVHVGDSFVLRVAPSVQLFAPNIDLIQGSFGTGVGLAQGAVPTFESDATHLQFVVPSTAHLNSMESLRFFTGSGWNVVAIECARTSACYGRRTFCADTGCGTYGQHFGALDDNFRLVPITIVP